jgi:polyisoprenoid-binding protein YceI
MKKLLFSFILLASLQTQAQKYFTKTGTIIFNSKSPVEKIEGVNKATACLLDTRTGAIDFIVQIKSFVFEKQLMQEHFNENYMESTKFPKAKFMGTIDNLALINFSKNGKYAITTSGTLEIHGVKQELKAIAGVVEVIDGKLKLSSKFKIKIKDYGIKGNYIGEKIANEIELTIDCILN